MTKKYKILGKYIKDLSSETRDIETYLFVKEYIGKYQLNIDINSKALKNKLIEISTTLKYEDKEPNDKKSYFEIVYATIIRPTEEVNEKKFELSGNTILSLCFSSLYHLKLYISANTFVLNMNK